MFVCVSTECLPDMPLAAAMERLAELEFTAVELDVRDDGGHLRPADVAADPEAAIAACSAYDPSMPPSSSARASAARPRRMSS